MSKFGIGRQHPHQAAAQGGSLQSPAPELGHRQGSSSEHVSEHSHGAAAVWEGGVTAPPNAPALGGCAAIAAPLGHAAHLKRPPSQPGGSGLEVGLLLSIPDEALLSRMAHKRSHIQ